MTKINFITARIEEGYYNSKITVEDLKDGLKRQKKNILNFREDLEHFHGMEDFSVGKRDLLFSVSWDFGFNEGELKGVYSVYSVISELLKVA